jgi:ubiquitin-protein ligase
LQKLQTPDGHVEGISICDVTDLQKWTVQITGAKDTLYANEKYTLQFTFPNNYPLEAPEVRRPRTDFKIILGYFCRQCTNTRAYLFERAYLSKCFI